MKNFATFALIFLMMGIFCAAQAPAQDPFAVYTQQIPVWFNSLFDSIKTNTQKFLNDNAANYEKIKQEADKLAANLKLKPLGV